MKRSICLHSVQLHRLFTHIACINISIYLSCLVLLHCVCVCCVSLLYLVSRCFYVKILLSRLKYSPHIYVRPLLEYCSPIWSPTPVALVNDLASVQRRFTKRLPGFKFISYDDRCARLGIDRLELRRLRADLILCYKILHGLVLLSFDDFCHNNRATRGHNFKLFIPESGVVDCRKRFFAVRINLMPDDVVSADSLSLFVGRLGVDLGGFLVGRS